MNLSHTYATLLTVSKAVFISVYTSLIAIGFGASAQLVSRNLLFCHGGGGVEEVTEDGEGRRRDRTRRAIKAQPADPNTIAISQAAAGTVACK